MQEIFTYSCWVSLCRYPKANKCSDNDQQRRTVKPNQIVSYLPSHDKICLGTRVTTFIDFVNVAPVFCFEIVYLPAMKLSMFQYSEVLPVVFYFSCEITDCSSLEIDSMTKIRNQFILMELLV